MLKLLERNVIYAFNTQIRPSDVHLTLKLTIYISEALSAHVELPPHSRGYLVRKECNLQIWHNGCNLEIRSMTRT